jgi:GxxExxY protein
MHYKSQQNVPIAYKGIYLDADLRYDVLVNDLIIVELKAMEGILPVHEAVVLSYMQMLNKPKGIIINFNRPNIMHHGQKTLVNEIYQTLN